MKRKSSPDQTRAAFLYTIQAGAHTLAAVLPIGVFGIARIASAISILLRARPDFRQS